MNRSAVREPGPVVGVPATLLVLFLGAKLALVAAGHGRGTYLGLAVAGALEAAGWTWFLAREYRRAGASDVFLLFPLVSAVYASVPAAVLAAGIEVFPFEDRTIWLSVTMASLSVSILWGGFAYVLSPELALRVEAGIRSLPDRLRPTRLGMRLFLGVGAAMTAYYWWNYVASGASEAVAEATRAELMGTVETGKTWLVQYLFACWSAVLVLILASPSARRSVPRAWLAAAVLEAVAFLAVYVRMGNRRELVFVLLFAAALAMARGRRRWVLTAAAVIVPLGVLLGVSRMGSQGGEEFEEALLQAFGEFVYPHFPLMYNVENATGLAMGATYARLPANVVPSFGLWTKAEPLAKIFADTFAEGKMGYAYTPLAEGYLNFGMAATLVVPLLLLAALWTLARWRAMSALPFLVFMAMALDVSRGDFMALTSEFALLLAMAYGLIALVQATTGRPEAR